MSKFTALLARAIAGLATPTAAGARAKIYQRARRALLEELCNRVPPLTDDELTKERLELEAAIREVEVAALHQVLAEMGASTPSQEPPESEREPVRSRLARWLPKRAG
jgi:hypothetical protein